MSEDPKPQDGQPNKLSLDDTDQAHAKSPPLQSSDLDDRRFKPGLTRVAWCVTILCLGFIAFNSIATRFAANDAKFSAAELLQPMATSKSMVGLREMFLAGGDKLQPQIQNLLDTQLESLDAGAIEIRFAYVIMVSDFDNPEKALEELATLKRRTTEVEIQYTDDQNRIEQIVSATLNDYVAEDWDANSVSSADRTWLKTKLLWFSDLLFNPKSKSASERQQLLDRAQQSAVSGLLTVAVVLIAGLAGLVGFFVFVYLITTHQIRSHFQPQSKYGPVYIETFAIWLVLYLGFSIVAGVFPAIAGLSLLLPIVTCVLALMWPLARGIPLPHLREDIGLKLQNPFKEIAAGIIGYIAALPLVFLGLAASRLVLYFMYQVDPPGEFDPYGVDHPIVHEATSGDLWKTAILLFLLAAVVAPLVEEIVFRGVLYRHLRDISVRAARWASVAFSVLVNSFLFAAIHPQGLYGIPALMSLAIGFSLVREWRGSIIAPITMHALNNGFITLTLIMQLI